MIRDLELSLKIVEYRDKFRLKCFDIRCIKNLYKEETDILYRGYRVIII